MNFSICEQCQGTMTLGLGVHLQDFCSIQCRVEHSVEQNQIAARPIFTDIEPLDIELYKHRSNDSYRAKFRYLSLMDNYWTDGEEVLSLAGKDRHSDIEVLVKRHYGDSCEIISVTYQ